VLRLRFTLYVIRFTFYKGVHYSAKGRVGQLGGRTKDEHLRLRTVQVGRVDEGASDAVWGVGATGTVLAGHFVIYWRDLIDSVSLISWRRTCPASLSSASGTCVIAIRKSGDGGK
jgi:hypothetical protein